MRSGNHHGRAVIPIEDNTLDVAVASQVRVTSPIDEAVDFLDELRGAPAYSSRPHGQSSRT
jgi:hypothetical protein